MKEISNRTIERMIDKSLVNYDIISEKYIKNNPYRLRNMEKARGSVNFHEDDFLISPLYRSFIDKTPVRYGDEFYYTLCRLGTIIGFIIVDYDNIITHIHIVNKPPLGFTDGEYINDVDHILEKYIGSHLIIAQS